MADTIVRDTALPLYVGDTATFTVSVHKVHSNEHYRVLCAAFDAETGLQVYGDAVNVDANLQASFVLGGSASAWTQNPLPAHVIAKSFVSSPTKPTEWLAQTEFDSPGAHP